MHNRKLENLPLEWVRVFEAAGRTGNFTAAAQEVGLTQAAVSQRIRNLETRIGSQLFTRQARGVTLTVEGEAWLPYVSNALQALNRSAEELFGKPLKSVTISASASITQMWIVPRLAMTKSPNNYQISITTMNIESDFPEARATVEIRYGNGNWPNKHKARLFKEALAPMAAPSALKSGSDWRELPRIANSGPRPGWQEWTNQIGESGHSVPALRFDNFVAAHDAAKSGLGVVLGSIPLCTDALANGSLVRLTKHSLELDEGYWMTANERLPINQWEDLKGLLGG